MTGPARWLDERLKDPKVRLEVEIEDLLLSVTEELVRIFEDAGVSQREIAERVGKAESSVSRALRGNHNLTFKTAGTLAFAGGSRVKISSERIDAGELDWVVETVQVRPERPRPSAHIVVLGTGEPLIPDGKGSLFAA